MTRQQREGLWKAAAVILLILAAYLIRKIQFVTGMEPCLLKSILTLLRHTIHVCLLLSWCVSLRQRILHAPVQRYLLSAGLLMAFWLTVRTCKWIFVPAAHPMERLCWYAFYIPIVFIPLMGVFVIDCMGKREDYAPRRKRMLYLPAFLLIVCVFTNDLHQRVFSFPGGIPFDDDVYHYEVLYFVIMAWVVGMSVYFVVMLLVKSRVPGRKSAQKLPALVLAAAVPFWAMYCLRLVNYDMTAANCLVIILLLECAIRSGLIPSNAHYNELFQMSAVAAQIVDRDYRVCYASESARPLSQDLMRQAESGPVDQGSLRLHSAPISGGHVLWQDDMTPVTRLMDQLREAQEALSEDNELLKAEQELRERQAQVAEKDRLYDRIAREVAPQLTTLEQLLDRGQTQPEQTRQAFMEICVISAYVKRRGNLLLLGEESARIPARELEYCLRESADNLRQAQVSTFLDSDCQGELPVTWIVAVYDLFEALTEQLLPTLNAMLIHLRCREETLSLRLRMGCSGHAARPDLSVLTGLGGTALFYEDDEDTGVDITLPGGGETP